MSHGKPLWKTVMENHYGKPRLAIGHIARIVAGEFTNYERTTIEARFEYVGGRSSCSMGTRAAPLIRASVAATCGFCRCRSPQSRRSRARGGGGQFERACTLSFGGKATPTFFSPPRRWEST